MKKLFFVLILVTISSSLMSQISKDALGIRLGLGGDIDIFEVELNYQMKISDGNRIEFGIGSFINDLENTGSFLVGMYQWAWNIKGNLNWYVGPGAGVSINVENKLLPIFHFNLGVGAQMGIEYVFSKKKYPFILSLDTRPMWDVFGDYSDMDYNVALGARLMISQLFE